MAHPVVEDAPGQSRFNSRHVRIIICPQENQKRLPVDNPPTNQARILTVKSTQNVVEAESFGGQEMDRLLMTQADCGIIGGLLFDDG